MCYSPTIVLDDPMSAEAVNKMLNRVIKSGHLSTIEHAYFTFEIIGVSRAMTHQLVRHRIASFSQQSQRYVALDEPSYVLPDSIDGTTCLVTQDGIISKKAMLEDAIISSWCAYNSLIQSGVPAEDARFVLPNACTTNITMSMNARELLHFLSLRMCNRAQWEIRAVADEMYLQLMNVAPGIFKHAGPGCWSIGCGEQIPCGHPRVKNE